MLALEVNGAVHLWDVEKNKSIATFTDVKKDQDWMQATCGRLRFSPDGRTLAFSRFSSAVQLWDLAGGKRARQLGNPGEGGSVAGIAISPNGRLLASFAIGQNSRRKHTESAIRLWEMAIGKQVLVLECPESSFRSVAYSPDGKGIVSGARDGTVRFWEVATGKELLNFREEGDEVFSVVVSPDGKTVGSAMSDGTVLIWDLSPVGWEGQAKTLGVKELEQMWSVLAEDDGAGAYLAIWKLAAFPEEHIPFLKARIRRVERADLERIRKLIAKLDDDQFDVREAASRSLQQLGAQVEPPLRGALAQTTSAEARLRIEMLLKACADWTHQDQETIRMLRVIWVLQRMGSAGAIDILQYLAEGAPQARVTQEARAALDFLAKQSQRR